MNCFEVLIKNWKYFYQNLCAFSIRFASNPYGWGNSIDGMEYEWLINATSLSVYSFKTHWMRNNLLICFNFIFVLLLLSDHNTTCFRLYKYFWGAEYFNAIEREYVVVFFWSSLLFYIFLFLFLIFQSSFSRFGINL